VLKQPAAFCLQVEDAVRAVAAKNNRPDPLLTGSRPLKMRYKPDKVISELRAALRSFIYGSAEEALPHGEDMECCGPGLPGRDQQAVFAVGIVPAPSVQVMTLCSFFRKQEQPQRRNSPGHPQQQGHGSPSLAAPRRDGSPQVPSSFSLPFPLPIAGASSSRI